MTARYAFVVFLVFQMLEPMHRTFAAAGSGSEVDTKRLDGVTIEAVENFINPSRAELSVGAGLFPLDPYYFGFSLNLGVTYYFSSLFGWEILGGSYAFPVQKDLTAQLAHDYGVNPQSIDKLEYVVSTAFVFVPTYGKSLLLNRSIQYFRSAFLLGPGLVKTSVASQAALSAGVRLDTYLTQSFSFRLEIRDTIALSGGKHFPELSLGTGICF